MSGGHFKLGLFVCIAVVLLVCFLLTLGALERFRPRIPVETYFEESITGLQRGARVSFRGVTIGSVKDIGFAARWYPEARMTEETTTLGGLVRVKLALHVAALSSFGEEIDAQQLELAVSRGLRAQLATTGLGGPTFISLDFADVGDFPMPTLDWTPANTFIPSIPSTVGSLINSLSSVLREADEQSVVSNLVSLSDKFASTLGDFEQSDLYSSSLSALGELRAASGEARALLADPRLDTILNDASAALTGARTLLDSDYSELETLIANLSTMAGSLEQAAGSLNTLATNVNESDLITDLRTLADELGPAGRDLMQFIDRLERLVKGNETQITDTIRALRSAVNELDGLLEEVKANPGRILADPPSKRTPGGGP